MDACHPTLYAVIRFEEITPKPTTHILVFSTPNDLSAIPWSYNEIGIIIVGRDAYRGINTMQDITNRMLDEARKLGADGVIITVLTPEYIYATAIYKRED